MIAVNTFTYALGKELGFAEASAEFQRQLSAPSIDSLPCVRVISRLRKLDELSLYHDAAASNIGKARSRAFHAALKTDPEVWVSVDDDVECDEATLAHLVAAAKGALTLCLAPCITRGSNVVNVALEPGRFRERELATGGRTVPCRAGGFGLVAMGRAAMLRMADAYRGLSFDDSDGESKLALFLELVDDGLWLGEDVSFCRRARLAGVSVEALVTGVTMHAGARLSLAEVQGLPEFAGY